MKPRYQSPWGNPTRQATQQAHQLTERAYLGLLLAAMAIGVALATGIARLIDAYSIHPILSMVGGIAMLIGGFEVSSRNADPAISFAGYLVSNVGLGMLIGPAASTIIIPMLGVTTIGIGMIGLVALINPRLAYGWGSFALAAVMSFLVLRLIPGALDIQWFTLELHAHVFGLAILAYIDYYISRALTLSRTVDNAIDSACAVYIDIVNQAARLANR